MKIVKNISISILLILMMTSCLKSDVNYTRTDETSGIIKIERENVKIIFNVYGSLGLNGHISSSLDYETINNSSLIHIDTFVVDIIDLKTSKNIVLEDMVFHQNPNIFPDLSISDINEKLSNSNVANQKGFNIISYYDEKPRNVKGLKCHLLFKANNIKIDSSFVLERDVTRFFSVH